MDDDDYCLLPMNSQCFRDVRILSSEIQVAQSFSENHISQVPEIKYIKHVSELFNSFFIDLNFGNIPR